MKIAQKTIYELSIESSEWNKIWTDFYKILETFPIEASPQNAELYEWSKTHFGDI